MRQSEAQWMDGGEGEFFICGEEVVSNLSEDEAKSVSLYFFSLSLESG